jgi:hypothetical protein
MPVPSPAVGVCEDLIAWYGKYAARARDRYRILEVALLVIGASISVAALAWPGNGVPAAILGGIVVVLTGLRQVFHWQENYVRFSWACQTLKQERRRYDVGESPLPRPSPARPEAHGGRQLGRGTGHPGLVGATRKQGRAAVKEVDRPDAWMCAGSSSGAPIQSLLHELFPAMGAGSETNNCEVGLTAGRASRYVRAAINTLNRVF